MSDSFPTWKIQDGAQKRDINPKLAKPIYPTARGKRGKGNLTRPKKKGK